jgi:hypothetical protein
MTDESASPAQGTTALEDSIAARYGNSKPGSFDRVMFSLLVPAFVLPPLAVISTWFGGALRGLGDADILALVIGVFMFVQLGSQVLNTWFILRSRVSYTTSALPRTLSVMHAITYSVVVAFIVVLFFAPDSALGFVFAGALAVLGCTTLLVIANEGSAGKARQLTPSPLLVTFSSTARLGTIIYLALAVTGLIAAAVIAVTLSRDPLLTPAIVGVPALILLMLGLPWSHTLYGILFVISIFMFENYDLTWIALPVLALPALANIAIAVIVLVSPSRRDSLISWFFRLAPKTPAPQLSDHSEGSEGSEDE